MMLHMLADVFLAQHTLVAVRTIVGVDASVLVLVVAESTLRSEQLPTCSAWDLKNIQQRD